MSLLLCCLTAISLSCVKENSVWLSYLLKMCIFKNQLLYMESTNEPMSSMNVDFKLVPVGVISGKSKLATVEAWFQS